MRIAIIGGGKRCKAFLEMLDAQRFPHLQAQIVAVADPYDQAPGIQMAKRKGITTTRDYRDFYEIPDLDLVIELTGKEELLEDFLRHKPPKVRVLESALSRLFGDMIRFREEYLFRERQMEIIESIIESLFSSMQEGVLIIQPDFRILDANEAFLQWMGLNKEDVIGKFCYEVTHRSAHPCSGEGVKCPLKETVQSGSTSYAIHEHLDRGKQPHYCEVTTVPLKDKKGRVEMVLEIVRDITDALEKRVEQKTRALRRDLARVIHEEKMIALGTLVASAVHEINNPLSGIHALARLVHQDLEEGRLTGEDVERHKYYLGLIDTESARCSSIVQNLLSFSRLKEVEPGRVQLNDVVNKVIHLCRHKMETEEIRLHLDLAEDLPEIPGDTDQIQQCLLNLVFNAMEAMPDGGVISVTTQWDKLKNQMRLEVADTGTGIPQEMMSHIFEPFFSTKSHDKGVGLGLSVVYGIVKGHGGTIYVKSEEGVGARFIIRFPVLSTDDSGDAGAAGNPSSKVVE